MYIVLLLVMYGGSGDGGGDFSQYPLAEYGDDGRSDNGDTGGVDGGDNCSGIVDGGGVNDNGNGNGAVCVSFGVGVGGGGCDGVTANITTYGR